MEIAAPIGVAGVRRAMARPREFDETTVLEAAMNRFWAQGFEQTSVRDLAEQMGITGASLYNAFGDKRSLYRQAFVHYLAQTVRDRVARLDKLPPVQAIRSFFDEIIERSVDDEQRRGCMLVNAALELAPYDPEFQQLVAEEMMFIETFFRRCAEAGQQDGSITDRPSADELAKLLLSVLLGIRVLARTRPQREVLEGAARGALSLLGRMPSF
jgi:TetR/AcrR family transcriptional repressor of nem operon